MKVASLFPERRRERSVVPGAAPVPLPAAAMPTTLGRIVAAHGEGQDRTTVLIDYAGSPHGARPARLAITLTANEVDAAVSRQQPAVLVFENGDPLLPIVIGLVQAPLQESSQATIVEADVDGKRVRVVGQDEIVLQCGQASVTLRRNGRIVIRGTYVETHSEGTNRIKGGQVQIN
ncbi:MAG TPA: DUF6484 domain-containing protein [Povalibacter sp.]